LSVPLEADSDNMDLDLASDDPESKDPSGPYDPTVWGAL
jgi:hypothetical protein